MSKVIIESHIPYVGDSFLGVADAQFLPPEEITPETVRDADALIVRTRTRCDASLLEGSKVRFVATATIGTDHIDQAYCREHGIEVVSAPGCNAPAVAQYVWASVLALRPSNWQNITMGIVGLGHVGSIVADWGRRLGVKVLACDPPRARMHGGWNVDAPALPGGEKFLSLEELAGACDVITFHTPHTKTGAYATHHLAGSAFFEALKQEPIFINAARGPVMDTESVLRAVTARKLSGCVIDCWEGEPAINRNLLQLADIATPHIAGYSIEGKRRATAAVVAAALRFFGNSGKALEIEKSAPAVIPVVGPDAGELVTPQAIAASYSPLVDSFTLKSGFTPEIFERLRNTYKLRHELGVS